MGTAFLRVPLEMTTAISLKYETMYLHNMGVPVDHDLGSPSMISYPPTKQESSLLYLHFYVIVFWNSVFHFHVVHFQRHPHRITMSVYVARNCLL